MTIDRTNAQIRDSWDFTPFQVPPTGIPLKDQKLPGDYELILVERNGERRALSRLEMAYHHVAQGTLAGEPYLVSF